MGKIVKNKHLNLARLFILIFMLYVMWYNDAITENRILLYASAIGATFFVTIDTLFGNTLKKGIYSIIPLLISYIASSFVFGIIFSADRMYLLSSLVTLVAFTVICFDVCYISKRLGNMDWLLTFFLIVAFVCAFQTIFFGQTVKSSTTYVITMGAGNNPNSLGLVMLLGIFAITNRKNYRKNYLFTISSIAIFMYVIILSGSRKFLMSGVALVAVWLFIDLIKNDENGKIYRKLLKVLIIMTAAIFGAKYISQSFMDSASFVRLLDLSNGNSINGRLDLYIIAFELFKSNPFFGVGYRQYEIVSGYGLYSHSTYAEILACTGVIGVLIWVYFIFKYTKKLILKYKEARINGRDSYRLIMCIVMLGIELFIGLGQIWFYDSPHLLILTFLFGLANMPEFTGHVEDKRNGR